MSDFTINDQGSVVVITPMTDAAAQWIEANVHIESWQWLGRTSFACDHHMAQPLIDGIIAEGFEVAS